MVDGQFQLTPQPCALRHVLNMWRFDSLTEQELLVVVCCGWPQSSETGDVQVTRLSAEQPHRSLGCYTA